MLDRRHRLRQHVGRRVDVAQQAQRQGGVLLEQVGQLVGARVRAQAGDQGADAGAVGRQFALAPVLAAGHEGALEQRRPELVAEAEFLDRRQLADQQARVGRDLERDVAQLQAASGVQPPGLDDDEIGLRQQVGEFGHHRGVEQTDAETALAQLFHGVAQRIRFGGARVGVQGRHQHHIARRQAREAGVGEERVRHVDEGDAMAEQLADVGAGQAAHQDLGVEVMDAPRAVPDARACAFLEHELVAGDALVAAEDGLAAQEGGGLAGGRLGRLSRAQGRVAVELAKACVVLRRRCRHGWRRARWRAGSRAHRRCRAPAEQPAEKCLQHGGRPLSGCSAP